MNSLHKQLVIRKREDWALCRLRNVHWNEDSFTLEEGCISGLICLKAIDSGEMGFNWGRTTLGYVLPEDSLIRTRAYASDYRDYGKYTDIDKALAASEDEFAELEAMFGLAGQSGDFYLDLTGRYLWLIFEFLASDASPRLDTLRLHISGDHMIDYLPEIYRKGGSFTKRFLSVFDSVFIDMEKAIYDLPSRFDYESADTEMLRYLAEWVCVDGRGLEDSEIIERISGAFEDFDSMFTLRGVKRSVRRLCGHEPLIIESADVDPNKPGCADSELYRRLYGENPYKFFILLDENSFLGRTHIKSFMEKMRLLIPANTEFELVLLKHCVRLDRHTYLGINSAVNDYVPAVIDENTTIHYDTAIGGKKVEGA